MNVIIANKYRDALSNLNVDVIKRLDGEFDIDTLIETFENFYFNRMILDITALKDSLNIMVIQKLSAALDASKIILFLSDDPRINNSFLSKIISLGIYNFTSDIAGVAYLMENPNSYRDVAQYHDLALQDEKVLTDAKNGVVSNATQLNVATSGMGYATTQNQNVNTTEGEHKIIGFKDLTENAGATTLIYMLKKNIKNKKVLAVEINNNDFSYFNDNELMSVSSSQLESVRGRFKQFDIVLVDLNNSNLDADGTCTDVIYLLEPSTIKLNSLMRRDRQALMKIKDKKIVLNKSLLTVSDVKEFEYEAKVKMFYNIPPLDERQDTQMVLDSFLEKLGINQGSTHSTSGGGLFSIFKK